MQSMRGRAFLGIPFMDNKQAEPRVQRHTGKQVDNGVDCAAVVKWSGKPSGLVERSSQGRQRESQTEGEVRNIAI